MKIRLQKIKIIFALATMLLGTTSFAWDGVVTGKIANIQITSGGVNSGNYDYRVLLTGVTIYCTNQVGGFGYLNKTDPNYKVYVAQLMLAKAMNQPVTIWTSRDAAGYCQIGYMSH